MTHQYGTPERRPLDEQLLADHLRAVGFVGEMPHYSRVTTSTQEVARSLYEIGKRPHYSVVTDEQTAGRGRLARAWTAPAGSSVLLTVVLPVDDGLDALPLRIGVNVARILKARAPLVGLKWPNDLVVVIDGELRKLGGIIAEVHGDAVLVGIGINVDLDDSELPTPQAISLRHLGSAVERESLLAELIASFTPWTPPTLDEYRALCVTIGAEVEVSLTDGSKRRGIARSVTDAGSLLVDDTYVAAGDVQHVRPA